LASIKVSELPAITAITASDVLIINDENSTTSSITISNFTSSFAAQDLAFAGTTSFGKAVTFLSGSNPTFSSSTVFSSQVTFNGAIVLGAAAQIPLGSLSNVTLAATITNGNVLTWNQTAGYWEASAPFANVVEDTTPQLGGNLETNGYQIASATTNAGAAGKDIILNPNTTGKLISYGNTTRGSGSITLNCENNSHGVTVVGPAHAAAATYTFILPVSMGTSGQVLSTNGANQTSWTTLTAASVGAATTAQGSTADSAMQVNGTNVIPAFANDSAAGSGGVVVGGLYRIGNAVQVRLA